MTCKINDSAWQQFRFRIRALGYSIRTVPSSSFHLRLLMWSTARMNLSALIPAMPSYVVSLHIALNGFWAQRVIMGWLAWEMTGSASFVGLVAFLNFVPTLFVSPLFGVVADRIDVRLGSICSYANAGTLSGIFAAISILGGLTPALLALFSLLTGTVSSANHPMRMSLTPRLAPARTSRRWSPSPR